MEFKDPKYIEVKLTKEERDTLSKAYGLVINLREYMDKNKKTVYYYGDYEGPQSASIDELGDVAWVLNKLCDLEGVE